MINVTKLHSELVRAGIQFDGCDSSGCIHFRAEATQEQKDQASAIVAAHDPAEYSLQPEQQLIVANGLHVAKITTSVKYADPLPKTDIIIINGVEQEIDLVDGSATIEITSTTPGTVFALEYHGLYAVVEAK